MPKKAKELTALAVKKTIKPGLHAVGAVAGLLLQVTNTGARSWILRVMIGSKRRDIGLGGYPDVTLSQARDKARELREKIKEGIDPIEERRAARERLKLAQANAITFDEAAEKVLAIREIEYKNSKHIAQWRSTLETYASPIIGKLPVSDIEKGHILKILEPIWKEKTETASRLRGRIENVLSWATVSDYRTGENPARWKGHLDQLLPKPRKTTKSNLTYRGMIQQIRFELARQMLETTDVSIEEIARELSYNSASNFSRAFRQWTGISPHEFRLQKKLL